MYTTTDQLCLHLQEPKNEYSHLDPASAKEAEVAEEDEIYAELGDLDGNDLMQFAYQIATGMVSCKECMHKKITQARLTPDI